MIIELNSLKFSDVIKRRPLGAFFILSGACLTIHVIKVAQFRGLCYIVQDLSKVGYPVRFQKILVWLYGGGINSTS